MFFDVTRQGTDRSLRVSALAVAFLDDAAGGTVLHLMGGHTLLVAQDRAEIETRARDALTASRPASEPEEPAAVPVNRGEIDQEKEIAAIQLAEPAGIVPPGTAVAQRVEQLKAERAPAEAKAHTPRGRRRT